MQAVESGAALMEAEGTRKQQGLAVAEASALPSSPS